MSPLTEARAHLLKAREFLEAAEFLLDLELFNAVTSNAVTSAINAKDAICLALTGTTGKTDNHADAVDELRKAGSAHKSAAATTKQLATVLGRVLRLKNKSQYQTIDIARTDAAKAVEWAQKLVDGATDIVAG